MSGLEVAPEAIDLIKEAEGWRSAPYLCPAKVWTIGYGSTRDLKGQPVTPQTPSISPKEGLILLQRDVEEAAKGISKAVSVPLTPSQRGALVSFVYNFGIGAFRSSTLLKKLNAGDYQGAAEQFKRWVYAGKEVLPGLVKRRAAEYKLFAQGL